MDWNAAIEKNREALKRILAMLVAMAGLSGRQSAIASRQSETGPDGDSLTSPDCPLPIADCRPFLPRHLHRAVLRLLRPAESAARRLVIVAARGLVVTLPRQRPRKAKPTILRNGVGTGILMPRNVPHPEVRSEAEPRRTLSLPLFDPLRSPFRRQRPAASNVPRISSPGFTAPFPVVPRHPLTPNDPLDATRLALRLQALASALDDLPAQAKRFARWRSRPAACAPRNTAIRKPARVRRVWPLRPGRPPGALRRPVHEIHDVLNIVHGLAFWALQSPDTS